MSEEIKKFLNSIQPYADAYKSLDIRLIAYKFNGQWLNLATRIMLEVIPPEKLKIIENLPLLPELAVYHVAKPFSELGGILDNLSQGKLVIEGKEIHYVRAIEGKTSSTLSLYCRTYPKGVYRFWIEKDFKLIILSSSGETLQSFVKNMDELDWQLQSLEYPWDGVKDLARNFIFQDTTLTIHDSTRVNIIAPSYIRFIDNRCKIQKGKLILDIESLQKLESSSLKCGILEHSTETQPKRYSLKINGSKTKRQQNRLILTESIHDCSAIDVFLTYNSDVADRVTLYNIDQDSSNQILKIHDNFDPQFRVLKKYLLGEGKDRSNDFELGVAMLLSLIGFITYPYGVFTKAGNVPDGVAFIPDAKKGLIYECTLELPDANNKLSKLSFRTKKLKDFLDDFELASVIFTAMEYDKIPGKERREAGGEMISLISVEYIGEIFNMFIEGKSTKKIFNYIAGLIPPAQTSIQRKKSKGLFSK